MLIQILSGSGSFGEKLLNLVMILIIVLISLTFHEVSHGLAAYKLGDPTARNFGRLSLDPRKHLDPIGTLMMLFIGVGYAKPVPVNSRYFKKPRLGMALTAAAGPAANFILAFFSTAIYLLCARMFIQFYGTDGTDFAARAFQVAFTFFQLFSVLNLSLAIFNLIPIPPFDGSRILFIFLPEKIYFAIMKYERYILFAILILLWTGVLRFNIVGTVAGWFSSLFVKFWSMIPFLDIL